MNPDLSKLSQDLRAGFPHWDPIQRGEALVRCQRAGLTNRTLAKMVNLSEASVRNHVLLLALSPADQRAIQTGAPMRPYLARLRDAERRRKQDIAQQSAAEHASAAERAIRELRFWFRQQRIGSALAERILLDAHALIRMGQEQRTVKPSDSAWGGEPAQISVAARPRDFDQLRGLDRVNGFIFWLARFLVRLLPNADTRDRAIYAALDKPLELGIA